MTPTAVRRPARVHGSLIWAATGAAVAVHALGALAFVLLLALGGDAPPHASRAAVEPEAAEEEVDLQTTCAGDARLATVARAALCLAPWNPDAWACGAELEMMMWIDLSACRARNDAIAAVAMVPQAQVEKVTPIDPEPLVEEQQQQEKPPPPPPPPPPQPQAQQQPPPPPPPSPLRPRR